MTRSARLPFIALAIALAGGAARGQATYHGAVRAVLKRHCVSCHGAASPAGGVDLSTFRAVVALEADGLLVARDASDSLLYLLAAHEESPAMPPDGERMPDADLAALRAWIDAGMPEGVPGEAPPAAASPPATAAAAPSPRVAAKVFRGVRPAPVVAVAVAGGRVAVGGPSQVTLYTQGGDFAGTLPFPEGEVQSLRPLASGERLLATGGVGAQSGALAVWDPASGERLLTIREEGDAILAADLTADGSLVAWGGPLRAVKLVDAATGTLRRTLDKHTDWVLALRFSPDGLLFASADRAGNVYVFEAQSGEHLHTLRGHVGPVRALAWRPDGDTLVTACDDGKLRLWDMHTGALIKGWPGHEGGALAIDSADSGPVSAGRDLTLRRWSWAGAPVGEPEKLDNLPTSLAAAPDGAAAVGDFAGVLTLRPAGSAARELAPPAELMTSSLADLTPDPAALAAIDATLLAVVDRPETLAQAARASPADPPDDNLEDDPGAGVPGGIAAASQRLAAATASLAEAEARARQTLDAAAAARRAHRDALARFTEVRADVERAQAALAEAVDSAEAELAGDDADQAPRGGTGGVAAAAAD